MKGVTKITLITIINWITNFQNNDGLFEYENTYFRNGNVRARYFAGDYNNSFANTADLNFTSTYDKSNRLLKTTGSSKNFEVENTYDKDGNIISLKRHDSQGNVLDNFSYAYYSGTNKLRKVTGGADQYTYDANGNMTCDDINNNKDVKYDHRNLITQLRHKETVLEDSVIYVTYYGYDEAGNRFAKTVFKFIGTSEPSETPGLNDAGANDDWQFEYYEIYSRDLSGRIIAIFRNQDVLEYPLYGLDMVGKIKNDVPYYYLKDHLGSVRAILNANNEIVSAQDYDSWGYLLTGRTYQSSDSKFKFTEKERDVENTYDYFGARYYDSRIGNWTSIDPLMEKHHDFSPYNYVLRNPLKLIDPDGNQIDFYYVNGSSTATMILTNPLIDITRVYVEHEQGNITGPNSKGLGGRTFFEANSEATMFEFLEQSETYSSGEVVTDFETSQLPARTSDALSKFNPNMNAEDYAFVESHAGQKMDQKNNLSKGERGLYLFQNKIYSGYEAGNIVWGSSMFKLNIELWKALAGAQYYALKTYWMSDQENEQQSIIEGYKYEQRKNAILP